MEGDLATTVSQMQFNTLAQQFGSSLQALGHQLTPKSESFLDKALPSFFASLTGALTAFSLAGLRESATRNAKHNELVNHVKLMIGTNVGMLCSFKKQFLDQDYTSEFEILAKHAAQYGPHVDPKTIERLSEEWATVHTLRLKMLDERDKDDLDKQHWNGLFKAWVAPKMAAVDAPSIAFLIDGMPDALRLVIDVADRYAHVTDFFPEREKIRAKLIPLLIEPDGMAPTPQFMGPFFDLLDARATFLVFVNQALVLSRACEICLDEFQVRRFEKKLLKKLRKKYPRIQHVPSPGLRTQIPAPRTLGNREFIGDYPSEWFGPQFKMIKERWGIYP